MGISDELEAEWPNLARTSYQITSPYTNTYNCFAWVVGETDRWWSPLPEEDFYWPEGAPRAVTVEALVKAYEIYGYEVCETGNREEGVEKIAIYGTVARKLTHAIVRRLPWLGERSRLDRSAIWY